MSEKVSNISQSLLRGLKKRNPRLKSSCDKFFNISKINCKIHFSNMRWGILFYLFHEQKKKKEIKSFLKKTVLLYSSLTHSLLILYCAWSWSTKKRNILPFFLIVCLCIHYSENLYSEKKTRAKKNFQLLASCVWK